MGWKLGDTLVVTKVVENIWTNSYGWRISTPVVGDRFVFIDGNIPSTEHRFASYVKVVPHKIFLEASSANPEIREYGRRKLNKIFYTSFIYITLQKKGSGLFLKSEAVLKRGLEGLL